MGGIFMKTNLPYTFLSFVIIFLSALSTAHAQQKLTHKLALKACRIDSQNELIHHDQYGTIINQPLMKLEPPVIQLLDPMYTPYVPGVGKCRKFIHATAIKSLVENGLPLTSKNFNQISRSLAQDIMYKKQPEDLNLTDYYTIDAFQTHIQGIFNSLDNKQPFSIIHLQHLIRANRLRNTWCIPIICNIQDKTVLLCLAKQAQQNPVLFYIDPLNNQLEKNTAEYDLVSMIHDRCFPKNFLQKIASMAFLQPLNFFKKS